MPFDPNSIAPAARARFGRVGRAFSSEDAAAQAAATHNALDQFRAEVGAYGFSAAEEGGLIDANDALKVGLVGRDGAKGARKVTNSELLNHMFDSKGLRLRARSILTTARFNYDREGNTAAVNAIDAALATTNTSGADAETLRRQLHTLAEVLGNAVVAPKIPTAADLASTLTAQATSLDAADAATIKGPGTPTETAYLDLLDGYIVELCRAARRAARAAARDLGRPEIAKAFELRELYKTTRRREPEAGPQLPPA